MSDFTKRISLDLGRLAVGSVLFYGGLFYLDYVDIDYSLWLSWLLMPLLITFLLPAVIILLFYISAIVFHIYRHRHQLVTNSADWWHRSRKAVSAIWDAHGWLWHGYEISGFENIPLDSPVLFIYYHGALPIDMYYFMAKLYLYKNKLIHTVADRLLFKIPGWAIVLEGFHVIPGTVQQCVSILREGNMLAISPGGVYEAQFGSQNYRLLWKKRRGFAKVALEAKVPIVPLFTMNVREAFRTVGLLRRIFLFIYNRTRVPLAPIFGGFPVKLVTHVGKPIPYDGSLTPDQLHDKIHTAIEDLIEEHQRCPGSITRALIERFYRVPKTKKIVQKSEDIHIKTEDETVAGDHVASPIRLQENPVSEKSKAEEIIELNDKEGREPGDCKTKESENFVATEESISVIDYPSEDHSVVKKRNIVKSSDDGLDMNETNAISSQGNNLKHLNDVKENSSCVKED